MTQDEENLILQGVQEYNAESYLKQAATFLSKNKNLKVEITACEWAISVVSEKPIFKIWYSVDGQDKVVQVIESVFKDYNRIADPDIGIKTMLPMKAKIILRLAYILYKHRND